MFRKEALTGPIRMHTTYTQNEYRLAINPQTSHTEFELTVVPDYLYSTSFPSLMQILSKDVPSIFSCECFNSAKNSFEREVKNTETGHLFEHILLEHLCHEKMHMGVCEAEYNGITHWNWKLDRVGVFHIAIDIGVGEYRILTEALSKTLDVFNALVQSAKGHQMKTGPDLSNTHLPQLPEEMHIF